MSQEEDIKTKAARVVLRDLDRQKQKFVEYAQLFGLDTNLGRFYFELSKIYCKLEEYLQECLKLEE